MAMARRSWDSMDRRSPVGSVYIPAHCTTSKDQSARQPLSKCNVEEILLLGGGLEDFRSSAWTRHILQGRAPNLEL